MSDSNEAKNTGKLTVYYDGACPSCVHDRAVYEKLAGGQAEGVCWLDITGQEHALRQEGIDPEKALRELHVRDERGRVVSELDAYILLLGRVTLLKPLAWLIGLPLIRSRLAKAYRAMVDRRLQRTGRG
jgi:predicted DCC family thiol-disulfide oxidoreductase YuxK